MAAIRKRSSILTLITICLLILLSSGGFFTMYLTHTIKTDAEVINKLGIIRGSIQRLVKYELAGIESNELIEEIDSKINEFNGNKIRVYDKKGEIQYALGDLCQTWTPLKESIDDFRRSPSSQNKQVLLERSEEVWTKSNTMVLTSQGVTERKVDRFQTSFIFFGINLGLGILIIFLIKRYVKDTLEYLVNYDGLTKLYNRRYFNEYLGKEISIVERYAKDLSLVMFDIDHFKKVNDTYGHDIGDSVLKELSNLVQNHIRQSDMLARIGGEEFAVVAPETDGESAVLLSEKIRKIVEEHDFMHVGKITISLGVTQFTQGDSSDSIYKRADIALYKAKNNGRNRSEMEMSQVLN
ncbi:GGDEF domain-containing protein [Anaerosolibacter sp.]|uniref:GGDEF domain-containing protein n=1 Tax=Anaerosolibacter sp. TaxID=1872527 RepID=UPI002601DCA3|nr:GGDEF domain-containing protein [Anaerosolibacter sp.]